MLPRVPNGPGRTCVLRSPLADRDQRKRTKTTRRPEFYANYERAQQLLRERIAYYEGKLKDPRQARGA